MVGGGGRNLDRMWCFLCFLFRYALFLFICFGGVYSDNLSLDEITPRTEGAVETSVPPHSTAASLLRLGPSAAPEADLISRRS
jgi:hypothetical protein